jgi:hypothetical protein
MTKHWQLDKDNVRTSQVDRLNVFAMVMAVLHKTELFPEEDSANDIKCVPD